MIFFSLNDNKKLKEPINRDCSFCEYHKRKGKKNGGGLIKEGEKAWRNHLFWAASAALARASSEANFSSSFLRCLLPPSKQAKHPISFSFSLSFFSYQIPAHMPLCNLFCRWGKEALTVWLRYLIIPFYLLTFILSVIGQKGQNSCTPRHKWGLISSFYRPLQPR